MLFLEFLKINCLRLLVKIHGPATAFYVPPYPSTVNQKKTVGYWVLWAKGDRYVGPDEMDVWKMAYEGLKRITYIHRNDVYEKSEKTNA